MKINKLLRTNLKEFRDRKNGHFLNSRLYNILNRNGITTVYDVVEKPFSYYERWRYSERNFGNSTLDELKKFVEHLELSFNYQNDELAMEMPGRKYPKGELVRKLMVDFMKSRRIEKGVSIEQLAQKLNIKPGTIFKIEELKFNPPVDLFFEILSELECKILLETEDDSEGPGLTRFILKEGEKNDIFTCIDMLTMVTCRFKKGAFNETQYFSLSKEHQSEIIQHGKDLSSIMSESKNSMAKWLITNHNDIL